MNFSRRIPRVFTPHSPTCTRQAIERKRRKTGVNYLRSALPILTTKWFGTSKLTSYQHIPGLRGLASPKPLRYGYKAFFAVILLFIAGRLTAQDATETPSFRERADFKVGYFGNLRSNQGLNLGTEYLWLEHVKVRERRKGQKTIKHQLLLNGSLGYSTSFATQTQNGLFAYSGLTLRRVNAKNRELFVELNPLGVYRSMLPDTYEVVGEDVTSVSFPGRSYYAPSLAFGIGRFRKAVKRSGWYLNLQYTVLTNYNTDVLPILSLHFGRKFNFNK